MPKRIDPSGVTGGLRAIEDLLRDDPRRVRNLVLQRGAGHPKLHALQKQAEALGIRVKQLPKDQLDAWFDGPHQGALAFCESRPLEDWADVRQTLLTLKRNGGSPVIVVPAAIEDPRNLGACVRSAAGLGVDAMLLPGKGAAGLTPAAARSAAGTEGVFPICRARDIEKDLKELSNDGFTIFGLDAAGTLEAPVADLKGPVVLVAGGEDRGIPPHIARCLTARIRLPMAAGCHSYNASVALSLLLYETARQRGFTFKRVSPRTRPT